MVRTPLSPRVGSGQGTGTGVVLELLAQTSQEHKLNPAIGMPGRILQVRALTSNSSTAVRPPSIFVQQQPQQQQHRVRISTEIYLQTMPRANSHFTGSCV